MHDSALRRALGYRRFSGETLRLLVFDSGYLVVQDVLDAAADLGWAVHSLPTPKRGELGKDFVLRLLEALTEHRPDFLLTINHLGFDEGGTLANLLADYALPSASWFVDHPVPILGGASANATPFVQLFCFERAALPWLQAQGYEAAYLPTASNARYFAVERIDAARQAALSGRLTFAGNSWWTKARVQPALVLRKEAKRLLRSPGAVEAVLEDRFLPKLKGVKLKGPRAPYALAEVALAEASLRRRMHFAQALAPLGLRIHGDPHWKKLAPAAELVDFVDYQVGLPALFAASEISINISAAQLPTAVNQRVWDVPACGGFLLTDAQEDVALHFELDREAVVFHELEEAKEKVQYYLAHPEQRAAIAARARTKVLAEHRYTHRLATIAAAMRQRFG